MAQDDYYYEIQLTNKQLVFYFMAGATGLILSFLAGVMVGRGLDGGEVQAARPLAEDRLVAEEPVRPSPAPSTEELGYARRLEGEKAEDGLERPKPAVTAPPAKASPGPPVVVASSPKAPKPSPAPASPPSPAVGKEPAKAVTGTFSIQVGAFKDRATADSVATRLKTKGFGAYVLSPGGADGGLFVVRVGSYAARTDAELVETRLRDQEKFKPYIVKN